METPVERNLILPGNPRSQPKKLIPIFGYDNLYRPLAEVEIATLRTLAEIGYISQDEIAALDHIEFALFDITTTEVDRVEREITHHDIRAWVRIALEKLDKLGRWAHVPLTSYDPLDTSRTLLYIRAFDDVLCLSITATVRLLAEKIKEFSDQVQIGRTHGQHALPITVGFWFATLLDRILYNFEKMRSSRDALVGKISGAVGAKNAQYGLGIEERCGNKSFEERVLEKLRLKPARISTQILPPEPLAYFLFSCVMMSAALGQLGRDCRHLMRSEIGEIAEAKEAGAVGSSTMAHKVNPINFEALEGEWLRSKNEFGKVLDSLISEHQRDLVASRLYRDFPVILVNLQAQLDILLREDKKTKAPFLQRLIVNREACKRNLDQSANLILAEPIYIALQMAGYEGDAHKLINDELAHIARTKNVPLITVVEDRASIDTVVNDAFSKIPPSLVEFLHHPESYVGNATEQALAIADIAEKTINNLAVN